MYIKGLKIVVFRGRYLVYYCHYNSYPEGLGNAIARVMPTEPRQYKAWLANQRDVHAEMTEQLESRALTASQDIMTSLMANQPLFEGGWQEIFLWTADDPLMEFPSPLCSTGNDPLIQWIYFIDLDRDIFPVDRWDFFKLYDIPCDDDRWIEAYDTEYNGERLFVSDIEPPRYFTNETESDRGRYHDIFQQYSLSMVKPVSDINNSFRGTLYQTLGAMMFEHLTSPFTAQFWECLPLWGHDNFAFREVAFAILSLATGQYYFDDPDRFYDCWNETKSCHFIFNRSENGEPKLMPLFDSGCRNPGQIPGSAPSSSIYWFEDVLVSLVPDNVLKKDTDAAVAKAVEFGLESKTSFQVVLFSVLNAMMFEVQLRDGAKVIRCARVVNIYDVKRSNNGEYIRADDDGGEYEQDGKWRAIFARPLLEFVCCQNHGFATMQNFFNTARNRQVAGFNAGCFPVEIYAIIIANVDLFTRRACAQVSLPFRLICQDIFPFSTNLAMTKFEAEILDPRQASLFLQNQEEYSLGQKSRELKSMGTFTFLDQRIGDLLRSKLVFESEFYETEMKEKTPRWCPVIGDESRLSILTIFDLELHFHDKNGTEVLYQHYDS